MVVGARSAKKVSRNRLARSEAEGEVKREAGFGDPALQRTTGRARILRWRHGGAAGELLFNGSCGSTLSCTNFGCRVFPL